VRIYIITYACLFLLSSSFLFVFDDDRVTCHTGVDGILGKDGDDRVNLILFINFVLSSNICLRCYTKLQLKLY